MSGNTEDVSVRLRLKNAVQFKSGVDGAARSTRRLGTDSGYTSRSMRVLDGAAGKANKAMLALGRQGAKLAVAGIVAVGYELKRSVKAWDEQLAANRRTNAVLKSTHGVSGQTAGGIARLSGRLAKYTGIQDDVVQGGANMLLTFTKVRNEAGKGNDIFNRATSAIVGFSQATGKSLPQAAIQLGKALQDPEIGLTALRKSGLTFSKDQQKQLVQLAKTGQLLTAQKIILREYVKEFPKVKGTSFQRLKVTIDQVEESIGRLLLPTLNRGARALDRFLQQAEAGTGTGGKFRRALEDVGDAFRDRIIPDAKKAYKAVKPLLSFLNDHRKGVAELAVSFVAISGAIQAISKIKRLTGLGKVAQAAKGLGFGSRGATPKNPLWVAIVNGGAGGGSKVAGKLKTAAKAAVGRAALAGGPEGLAVGALVGAPLLARHLGQQRLKNHPHAAQRDRDEASRQLRSHFGSNTAPPKFDAQGFPIPGTELKPASQAQPTIVVPVHIDGREVARAVHKAATKAKALI